jgi:glycosyltransferase involved in cell wall biosynthesis
VDGLEWMRPKWSGLKSKYSKWAERRACKWANEVIADSTAIKDHIFNSHNVEAVFIPYGAESISVSPENHATLISKLNPTIFWKNYFLVVARWEPENHVSEIIEAYLEANRGEKLVVVGGSQYESEYSQQIRDLAARSDGVLLLGSIWEKEKLDALYCGAKAYIHGHSVGGTNPSLLRAMGAGSRLIPFDCEFNRETANNSGIFWTDKKSLVAGISKIGESSDSNQSTHKVLNSWDEIADSYSGLALQVLGFAEKTEAMRL